MTREEEKYTTLDTEQCKWWVNHLFNIAKEKAFNSHNFDDAKEIQSAQDKIIEALKQDQAWAWAKLWARLYSWLADMHLSIAPDETVTDIDERNVRIAQVDLLNEIMDWMDKPKITNYYINEKGQRVEVDYDIYDMGKKIIEGLETPEANGFRKCGEESGVGNEKDMSIFN